MGVDEINHELVLQLSSPFFGFSTLYCDSVALPATTNGTIVRAAIPDSGRGSCGPVWMRIKGELTNTRLLSRWRFYNYYEWHHIYSDAGSEEKGSGDDMVVRFEYRKDLPPRSVQTQSQSSSYEYARGEDGMHGFVYYGPTFDRRRRGVDTVRVTFREIDDTHLNKSFVFDSTYRLSAYNFNDRCGNGGYGKCDYGGPRQDPEFPPMPVKAAVSRQPKTLELTRVGPDSYKLRPLSDGEYKIFDLLGRLYKNFSAYADQDLLLDLNDLPKGLYFLQAPADKISRVIAIIR